MNKNKEKEFQENINPMKLINNFLFDPEKEKINDIFCKLGVLEKEYIVFQAL